MAMELTGLKIKSELYTSFSYYSSSEEKNEWSKCLLLPHPHPEILIKAKLIERREGHKERTKKERRLIIKSVILGSFQSKYFLYIYYHKMPVEVFLHAEKFFHVKQTTAIKSDYSDHCSWCLNRLECISSS